MSDCIFCDILSGEAAGSIVVRNEDVCAFMDIRPVNRGHVLVIPTAHWTYLSEVDARIAGELFVTAQQVGRAIRESGLRADAMNLYLADGEIAGQEIFHVHLHVIPRFRRDGFGLRFGPNYGQPSSRLDLDDVATRIRAKLG